jgi:hypothetical protein
MIKELTFLKRKEKKIKTMIQTVPTTTRAVLRILLLIIILTGTL